jgi:anti-sigma regulatory factor (Ser/Thr protein kinase)
MGVLGIINSDPEVKKLVKLAFKEEPEPGHTLKFLSDEAEILEFLRYELPEIVVINFTDPSINVDSIVSHIRDDRWVFNFGIVGLFSHKVCEEEDLLTRYKVINILTMLDNYRLRSHLLRIVQIIEENYQLIFQREFSKSMLAGIAGSFIIENDLLAVPLYAGIGATIVAQLGLISPENKTHLQLALGELIVNAVEHGNCEISYDEKTEKMEQGFTVVDLVTEKCKDPAVRAKKVDFQWEIKKDKSIFLIRDEGRGFDVKALLDKIAKQDMWSLHGRGIKMATMLGQELKYNDRGNQVALILNHDDSVEHEIPVGFSKEQIIMVRKGDIVVRENEAADYLYYISSGIYHVYHDHKQVGTLSPRDVFIGEVSFLLNQNHSVSVRAATPGKLILLTRKAFMATIKEHPHYGIFLSKLLAKRMLRGNKRSANMMERLRAMGSL